MTTSCEEVRRLVWAGDADAPWLGPHLETCTVCQLEARRAEMLTATLTGMHAELAEPPSGLLESLIGGLPAPERGWMPHRLPALGRVSRRVMRLDWVPAPHLERVSQGARRVAASPTFRVGAAMGAVAATAAFGLIVTRRFVRPELVASPPGVG